MALSEGSLRWNTRTKLFLIHGRGRLGLSGAIITIIAIFIWLLYELFVVIFLQVVFLKLVGGRIHRLLGVYCLSSFYSNGRVRPDLLLTGDVIVDDFPFVGLGSIQATRKRRQRSLGWEGTWRIG